MRKGVLCLVAGLMLSASIFGQRSTATLSGTATDSTGAVVPEARVMAIAVSTGTTTKTISNTEGFFLLAGLLPEVYCLRVEKVGFQTYSQENIVLQVDRAATVKVSQTVGNQTQTVTVTGAADQVNLRSQKVT